MGDNNDDNDQRESLDKTSVLQSDTFKLRIAEAVEAPPALVLLVGPSGSIGRQWALEESDRILGRAPSAHVFVDDRSLSKSHAKIVINGIDVSIIDLESTNKTIINGKVIPSLVPVKLKNNDQVKLGNLIFKFLERGSIESVASAQTFDRALTDALTGAANRGALDSMAPEYFKRSKTLGIPVSLVLFDIDHFKPVNDTWGHSAGDHILKELVAVIRDNLIRENDLFSRTGGEEFCIVLLGSPLKQAQEVAERVRHTIETHRFEFEKKHIPITISAGVATKSDEDENWVVTYDRADKALYHSKKTGRNRVSVG
jgi:two-component system cell cycle response regulator